MSNNIIHPTQQRESAYSESLGGRVMMSVVPPMIASIN